MRTLLDTNDPSDAHLMGLDRPTEWWEVSGFKVALNEATGVVHLVGFDGEMEIQPEALTHVKWALTVAAKANETREVA